MAICIKHFGYGTNTVHKTSLEGYIARMVDPDPYDCSGALECATEKVERLSKLVGVLVMLLYRQGTLGDADIKVIAEQMNPNCTFIAVEDV